MLDRFLEQLRKSDLIPQDASVLVGYSGGADSTCLLHLLKTGGFDVSAAHLHHGQREEAEKELGLCAAFCEEIGVPFVSGRADVPRMASDLRIGLEEAGRKARYAFFNQAALQLGCDLIATAHTRTDLIETVLLNIARGSGIGGLGGIPDRRENIVRPLLAFTREETQRYCDERGFWYHHDPANSDLTFSRARVRHRILSELKAINPSADSAIARLAETASEEDRFLNGMAAAALEQCETHLNGELRFLSIDSEAAFDRARLTSLPPVLFKRALRLATSALGGSLDSDQTSLLAQGISGDERGSITTEGGLVAIEWDLQTIHVRQLTPTTPFRYGLTVPGETISDEFGWQFTAFDAPVTGSRPKRADLSTQLDRSKIKGQLYFRTATEGDKMQPLGFEGHRKLSDLLSEKGLTRTARARLPIVCDMVGPLWAPGVCVDGRAAASEGTEIALVMSFGPVISASSHNVGNGGTAQDVP